MTDAPAPHVAATHIRASRMRVARSRGALGGALLIILGAWAALVPFIGSYLDLGTTPDPSAAWTWTAARGWLEVLPGAAAAFGGLLLLLSANRLVTSLGGWIAAASGAWLVVGSPLASVVHLTAPVPDSTAGRTTRALTALLTFYAIGAAIVLVAALALGRLSVHGLGDVRAAEKRARAEAPPAPQSVDAPVTVAGPTTQPHDATDATPSTGRDSSHDDDEFADYRPAGGSESSDERPLTVAEVARAHPESSARTQEHAHHSA